LMSGLLRRGMRDQVTKVDEVLSEICERCSKARIEVWQIPQDQVPDGSTHDVNGGARPPGADGVFWDSQQESQQMKEAPEVKMWTSTELVTV